MNNDPKATLSQILDSIGYEGDKDKYVQDFLKLSEKNALYQVLSTLPDDKVQDLKQKLEANNTPEALKEFISQSVDQEEYKKALQTATGLLLLDLINDVNSTLTDDQRQKLVNTLGNISSQSTN